MDEYVCYNGYELEELKIAEPINKRVAIIHGAEHYVKALLEKGFTHRAFLEQLTDFIRWEQEAEGRKLVVIGTDMSKGVVPMDRFMRLWRDEVGWCYQQLMKQADIAHMIWYQIPQVLKNKEELR